MSAAKLAAGAQSTAETAELRKAEGKRGAKNCGITAERLRKHLQVSDLSPPLDPAPGLVRPHVPKKPRESPPAEQPPGPGMGLQRHEQAIIDAALAILASRMRQAGAVLATPQAVKDYLTLHLAGRLSEAFGVLYLDAGQRMIAFEVPFSGTLTHTSVHPREIVRRALELNAGAVILTHNHPGGTPEPSRADELITHSLRAALGMVDVRVLDHVIVASRGTVSFAERGLL